MAKNKILVLLPRLKGILLIFFLSVYFYVLAGKIEGVPTPGQLGPAFWPKATLILLMIGCGIKALEIFFSLGKEAEQDKGEAPSPAVNHIKLFTMIALVILAVVAMDEIGFLLANLLFLIFFMRVAGMRKKMSLLLTSILGTILLLYLFVKVVYLPLPKGHWFFEDLTIFIYRILRII
jgi:putative tricarboxylic transport membrane protein